MVGQLKRSYKVVDRQVGLLGGTVLLVGTVVGTTVFLLPGALIGEAGPSLVPAFAVAAIPMLFAVATMLQLGGAMPVAGGVYVYSSRLIGPFWGFLAIWLVVPAIWAVQLVTAIGFAQFTRFFVDIPAPALMVGVLALFLVLNLFGIRIVTRVQLVMVVAILLGMLAFILPGLGQMDMANYSPMFPNGPEAFVVAVITLYIPFQGFAMVIELGEELKNPIKNIPRVLMFGMGAAILFSVGLAFVFVGLDRWDALAAFGEGGVAEAAGEYLPAGIGPIVAIAAVLGAFTTLNAIITAYSRTVMRAARDGVLSPRLAEIHPKTGIPHWAVVVVGFPPILLVPFGFDAITVSVFLALAILFGGFFGAIALWNLPKRYPDNYKYSFYRLPMPLLKTAAIGSAVSSVMFWLAMLSERPEIISLILALAVAGYVFYRYRVRWHAARGVALEERLALLDDHEQRSGKGTS